MTRWGALVATYRRPDTVRICLKLLLEQTRRPDEIIVVAAEGDELTQEETFADLRAQLGTQTRLIFVRSAKGLTRQRNAGIAHIGTETCLFLDDDCFAPPEFVDQLMQVFDADHERLVGGVAGIPLEGAVAQSWWEAQNAGAPLAGASAAPAGIGDWLKSWKSEARRGLERWNARYVGAVFPPVHFDPKFALPSSLRDPSLKAVSWLPGGCTAYRTDALRRFKFCEAFAGYAAAEDVEFSYRVGREYCLVRNEAAILYHMQVGSGRPDPRRMVFSSLLNLAYIARTAMPQDRALREFVLAHHLRASRAHALMGFLGRRGLGEWRAGLEAYRATEDLFNASEGGVDAKYREVCERWERESRHSRSS